MVTLTTHGTMLQQSDHEVSCSAWPVNFNYNLSFFESSVHGLRNLVNFALTSPQFAPPHLLFISSVGILRRTRFLPISIYGSE